MPSFHQLCACLKEAEAQFDDRAEKHDGRVGALEQCKTSGERVFATKHSESLVPCRSAGQKCKAASTDSSRHCELSLAVTVTSASVTVPGNPGSGSACRWLG